MNISSLASLFKSLSEPVRLRIISLLLEHKELCVCEIVDTLKLSQSVVSRHLAYLRNNQLVITERKGAWMYYKINQNTPIDTNILFQFLAQCSEKNNEMQSDKTNLKHNRTSKNQCIND